MPAGVTVKQTQTPDTSHNDEGSSIIEVSVQDVPPSPEEEYMPPLQSLGYLVLSYYSPYRTPEEHWRGEGKHWSKVRDKFIGPGPAVGAAVNQLAAPSDTPDQKLRKLYAAVEQIENTDYTREHSRTEDKAEGLPFRWSLFRPRERISSRRWRSITTSRQPWCNYAARSLFCRDHLHAQGVSRTPQLLRPVSRPRTRNRLS